MSTFKNWKTTLAAIGIALVEIGKLLQGDTSVDIESILIVFGLLFAGDSAAETKKK